MPNKSFLMTMSLSLKESSNILDKTKGNYNQSNPEVAAAMLSAHYVTGALAKAYEDAARATDETVMVNETPMMIIPIPE